MCASGVTSLPSGLLFQVATYNTKNPNQHVDLVQSRLNHYTKKSDVYTPEKSVKYFLYN